MNILFVYDKLISSGLGHESRCYSLIKFFKKKKINCIKLEIKKKDINSITKNLIKIILKKKIKLVVKDSYVLNYFWEKKIAKYTKLAVISDQMQKASFCDYFIYYHPDYFKIKKKLIFKKKNCTKFLGPEYVIVKNFPKNLFNKKLKSNIFVYMGGVDKKLILFKIAKILNKNYFSKFSKIFLVNKNHLRNRIFKKIKTDLHNAKFINMNKTNICKFFFNTDISITGGGMSMYEQLLLTKKNIIIPQNILQKKILKNFKTNNKNTLITSVNKLSINKILNFLTSKNHIYKNSLLGFNKNGKKKICNNIIKHLKNDKN